jgi:ATP-dependent Clp protease adaptor protein ClpS
MARGIDLLPAVLPEVTPERSDLVLPDDGTGTGHPYVVILYNCECHTFDDVIIQLQKATGCTAEKAEALAYEIDGKGRAIVFGGTSPECERAANILRQIRLQVETDRG